MKKKLFLGLFVTLILFVVNVPTKSMQASSIDQMEQTLVQESLPMDLIMYSSGTGGETNNEKWYNIGTSLPHAVTYTNNQLVGYLRKGDILYEEEGGFGITGHMAIVEGIFYDEVYDQKYVRLIEAVSDGVTRGLLTPNRFSEKKGQVYRVTDATEEQIDAAVEFCKQQLNKAYKVTLTKSKSPDNEHWYCSELVWAAYIAQGIYLDQDDNDDNGSIVWPAEVIQDIGVSLLAHYQYQTSCEVIDLKQHKFNCNGNIIVENHQFSPEEGYVYKCSYCGMLDIVYKNEEKITVDCHTQEKTIMTHCDEGYYSVFVIHVECSKSYTFTSTLLTKTGYPIEMCLYNSEEKLINDTPELSNFNMTGKISQYLSKGTYYLRVNYPDKKIVGDIETKYQATWPSSGAMVEEDAAYSMIDHLHKQENGTLENVACFINDHGASYYQVTLNVEKANGEVIHYPSNCLFIKDVNDENLLTKFQFKNSYREATNDEGMNQLYVFYPNNGYSYIHVNLPDDNYASVTIQITRVTKTDEFTVKERMREEFTEDILSVNQVGDYVQKLSIDRLTYLFFTFETKDVIDETISVVIFRASYNESTHTYSVVAKIAGFIDGKDTSNTYYTNFEEGTYYIGYFGNTTGATINVSVRRQFLDFMQNNILTTDLSKDYECGTEVVYNNGAYRGTTILEGFTRNIYIDPNAYSEETSRLLYKFYSSNENVATVSNYGTVLAKDVSQDTEVTIYAVLRAKPDFVYSITFTIINDTSNTPREIHSTINHTYSFAETGGKIQFQMNNLDGPYPRFQDYMWGYESVPEGMTISMTQFGTIQVSGPGTIVIVGHYMTNPNIYVYITIHIV